MNGGDDDMIAGRDAWGGMGVPVLYYGSCKFQQGKEITFAFAFAFAFVMVEAYM